MKTYSPFQWFKLIIPLSGLILLLFSHYTPLGEWIGMEDAIIFMLCGLTLISGIESYKKQPSIGFFLIGSSIMIIIIRLILIIRF